MIPDGMKTTSSAYGPQETLERLRQAVTGLGMEVVAEINHAKAAADVGMELRPTAILVFGNPKAGTPLMQAVQTVAIDLPLKALVWQDERGNTWLGYIDPVILATRYGPLNKLSRNLRSMAEKLAIAAEKATVEQAEEHHDA